MTTRIGSSLRARLPYILFFFFLLLRLLLNPYYTLCTSKHSPTGTTESNFVNLLICLVLIWVGAKLGGELFERIKQPAVLGELLFGIFLGNLTLVRIDALKDLPQNEFVFLLAEIGVILLLFEVGLASNLHEIMEVGFSSLFVAVIGVLTPFGLGWVTGIYFLPQHHPLVHVFLGATLAATSVGITARVLKDLGKMGTLEARIILGAAVVDDVLGLLILAVVSGIIQSGENDAGTVSPAGIGMLIVKATVFFVLAMWIGSRYSPRVFGWASKLRVRGMLLITSISFCFLLAYCAALVNLAPLVGAFAAGLIMEPIHYADFRQKEEGSIEQLIEPLTTLFVPIFFVYMGLQVDLRTLGDPWVLMFAGVLTLVAIIGKLACVVGPIEKGLDRLSIAIGMIPRGEVGLIFAGVGMTLWYQGNRIVSQSLYSSLVMMVILTTLVTPIALKYSISRAEQTM